MAGDFGKRSRGNQLAACLKLFEGSLAFTTASDQPRYPAMLRINRPKNLGILDHTHFTNLTTPTPKLLEQCALAADTKPDQNLDKPSQRPVNPQADDGELASQPAIAVNPWQTLTRASPLPC